MNQSVFFCFSELVSDFNCVLYIDLLTDGS